MLEPEQFGPIKLSGRALYDDGQMINSNVIASVLEDIDSAFILKEEQRTTIKAFVIGTMFLPSFLRDLATV